MPPFARAFYNDLRQQYYLLRGRRKKQLLVRYLREKPRLSAEESQVLEYLLSHKRPSVFPYQYSLKYKPEEIEILYDRGRKLYYTHLFGGLRLYFKRKMTPRSCARYISSIISEQDPASPHCYLSDDFIVEDHSTVVDAGAAEGYFALSVINQSDRLYLFEPDEEWQEALQATFEPWQNKVTIVGKFISDRTHGSYITLDDYFAPLPPPNFIKADIEGYEAKLLAGATQTINRSSGLSLALCTYHNQADFDLLSQLLLQHSFLLTPSPGYIFLYPDKTLEAPYLRRGILRAAKL
jgi:hypothetical protein